MFMFGNMNDETTQMTQYIPMESLSKCMKEVRLLKKKNTGYDKDAFCGPGIVEIKDGEVIALYNDCLLYTSPSPRDGLLSRMPSSA